MQASSVIPTPTYMGEEWKILKLISEEQVVNILAGAKWLRTESSDNGEELIS
jgi:hypothetical protein